MNCSQCGALIEEGLKFCTQCGARVEKNDLRDGALSETTEENVGQQKSESQQRQDRSIEETGQGVEPQSLVRENEIKKERELMRPIVRSKPRKVKPQPKILPPKQQASDDRPNKRLAVEHRYKWENRRGLNGFAETLSAILINPIASSEELYLRLNKKTTILYMTFMILISACMSYLSFIMLAPKITEMYYDIFDYFFGYGTIQYILNEIGVEVLLMSILSITLLVVYITLLVLVVYKILLKVDIDWIECVQLMLLPIIVGFFGKVVILAAGILNIKVGLLVMLIMLILIAILTTIQFINRLGLSAITVYSMPAIYVISSATRVVLILQIIKSYYNK